MKSAKYDVIFVLAYLFIILNSCTLKNEFLTMGIAIIAVVVSVIFRILDYDKKV